MEEEGNGEILVKCKKFQLSTMNNSVAQMYRNVTIVNNLVCIIHFIFAKRVYLKYSNHTKKKNNNKKNPNKPPNLK